MAEELIIEKLNELNSMTDMETGKPTLPINVMLQESEELFTECNKDKEALVKAGLDWNLVEELPLRIDALKLSQARWRKDYKTYQDCQAEWKIAAPEAFNLRDELVHYFYHALYHMPGEYAKVKRIADGSTNADMIQDLIELAELGLDHTGKLEAVGLDLTLLDKARAKSYELGKLLAKVNGAQNDTSPKLDLRNKAYTHLKAAVDEIRRQGQFAFWRRADRYSKYASSYLRRMNEPRKEKDTPATV